MQDQETGYTLLAEAPEVTDEELDAIYLDQLEQTAPPIVWDDFCYCEEDNRCAPCTARRNAAFITRRAA